MANTTDQPEDFSVEAFRKRLQSEEKSQRDIDGLFSQLSEEEIAELRSEDRVVSIEIKLPKALKACIDEDFGNDHGGIRLSSDPFRAKVLMLLREGLLHSGIPFERITKR